MAKKWEPFKKAFLDQYFMDIVKEALMMEFINLVQGSMMVVQYEVKFTSLSKFVKAFFVYGRRKGKIVYVGTQTIYKEQNYRELDQGYSTMVSLDATIEEMLNETRKILNPKS